ncbi:zinc-binding dehydrogenase [Amycolatopsis sp. CA-230715]|uniref:zinc-binding dehydrogenase n=1 Tax=Amycolatopsis sp. CA-230715 TaxID=2745196 RepID=UPI001C038D2B|nr:zinc-binding dehydrogenase [Amycolatopsis sp. CA-230715]QWF82318.1 2-haloacrylate reductase [Amycolatopsis sp. CA-230715]
MRAVWLEEFGGPEVLKLGAAPEPEPKPGEVLVEVAFVNVVFVETQFRSGHFPNPAMRDVALPVVPGNGVGGVVSGLGPGTDPALLGTTVVTSTGGSGAYAERVAVPADGVLEVPQGVALDTAVALLADGRTAFGLFWAAGIGAGDRVLVEAAGGGVGSLLVQLAKSAGAQVIAAAGSAAKLAQAEELGADETVDYSQPSWAERVGSADVVFDGVGGRIGEESFAIVARGGRFLVHGAASGEMSSPDPEEAARRDIRVVPLGDVLSEPGAVRKAAEAALAEAAAGRLRPVIGQRFPLAKASDAHAAIEARTALGKTLLVP